MLLIQLPIFIALYRVIQIFTTGRDQLAQFTYDFIEKIPFVQDIIANPQQFNEQFLGFIDLTQHAISENGVSIVLVLLAVIAAVTQYISSKQTMPHDGNGKRLRDILAEAGQGKEPDQAEMNAVMMRKMIKFLPIMMFIIMLNLPGALALYFATSNIVAALQQRHILRKDEEELEKIAAEPIKSSKKSQAKEAKIVKKTPATTKKKSSETNVTRITAKDTKKKG